jgi:hypothetical protein
VKYPLVLSVLMMLPAACSFHARSPNEYRDATAALLETRSASVKACYEAALKTTPGLAGTVTVHFTVNKKTGAVTGASAGTGSGTATSPLGECVVNALTGLALDPPDVRNGDATFDYTFSVKS